MSTTVYIAIYKPADDRDPSHWAIFLCNGQLGDVILQVGDDKGGVGYFVDEPVYDKQPQRSIRHDKSIMVGSIASVDQDAAIAAIQATPVDNVSTTWNCQAWAVEALDGLEEVGLFTWDKKGKEAALKKRQRWQ
ncbi:hypothetical protein B0H66DRAFT_577389 [Apodospora peruviana]|uniref:Uncharacterized protein n=1 Tax=Apodospora peruviana TaxID=516989 RepID=A0AAE0LZE2_9PEZI|nr:hypothetical protein B0H66DRAFT_577389 [Apodospora peruviana]